MVARRNGTRRNHAGVVADVLRVDGGGTSGVIPGSSSMHGNAGRGIMQKPLSKVQAKKTKALNRSFVVFLATVFGEAGQSSSTAWKAVGHVIMNRVGYGEWGKYKTVEQIIVNTGFDDYQDPNYKYAYKYFSNNDANKAPNPRLDRMIEALLPVYNNKEADFTSHAILYYSPKKQKELHGRNHKRYEEIPKWSKSDLVEYVNVPGLAPTDDFKFYKYSKKNQQYYERIARKKHTVRTKKVKK